MQSTKMNNELAELAIYDCYRRTAYECLLVAIYDNSAVVLQTIHGEIDVSTYPT